MRVLIIGNLDGQLSSATKIAFDRGAKVHARLDHCGGDGPVADRAAAQTC